MNAKLNNFIAVKQSLLKYFNCADDYYIKPMPDYEWCVKQDDGVAILCYWKGAERADAVVVRKDGKPQVFRKSDYTMVVAIDCVKIAFVLESGKER